MLRDFIVAGCSVLLSDVDVVWLQNPFTLPSLYRDVDVEGMTDGWDDPSAFGYPWKDGQGAQQLRLSARNSGLFFIAATEEVLRMMSRLKHRMETEGVWDQTAYNEEMWYVARLTLPLSLPPALALALALALTRYVALPGRDAHGVSSRVLNYFCHMNSKTLFRYVVARARPGAGARARARVRVTLTRPYPTPTASPNPKPNPSPERERDRN